MEIPEDRKYTDQHEWVMESNGGMRVGITDYAQDALGDVVYVDLPKVGAQFSHGQTAAEVESTKSVAEIYAPLSGTVAAVNEELEGRPELINSAPYGDGWMFELSLAEDASTEHLLTAAAYREMTEG